MAGGSKTSTIPRARSRRASRLRSAAAESLIPRVLGRLALGIGLLVVLASFMNSFLLAPGRTWFGQRDEISAREAELQTIQKANDELQKDIDRLQTDAGIEDAARDELGYVIAGEERQTIIGEVAAPLDLPHGWPYDLVTQIVGVRAAEAAAEAASHDGGTPPIETTPAATTVTTP